MLGFGLLVVFHHEDSETVEQGTQEGCAASLKFLKISRPGRIKSWGPSPAELGVILWVCLSSWWPHVGGVALLVRQKAQVYSCCREDLYDLMTCHFAQNCCLLDAGWALLVLGLGDFFLLCISECSQVPNEWELFPAESLVLFLFSDCIPVSRIKSQSSN